MKTGMNLQTIAQTIREQESMKRDFIASANAIEVTPEGNVALAELGEQFAPTEHFHQQAAAVLQIPKAYYDRVREGFPALFRDSFNTLMHARADKRMVRTLGPGARALLSSRYQRLDHAEMLEAILPVLAEHDDLALRSADVTEKKLYLKLASRRLTGEVRKGDVVQFGVIVSNSEIGAGAYSVQPFSFRLACTNGAVHNDFGSRRAHVGRQLGGGDDGIILLDQYADDTVEADSKALVLKTRDTVRALLSETTRDAILGKMREAADIKMTNPAGTVELLAKSKGLQISEKTSILTHLIEGGDCSLFGLGNAVTRTAEDVGSYDRATELEALGGAIQTVALPEADIKRLLAAPSN